MKKEELLLFYEGKVISLIFINDKKENKKKYFIQVILKLIK